MFYVLKICDIANQFFFFVNKRTKFRTNALQHNNINNNKLMSLITVNPRVLHVNYIAVDIYISVSDYVCYAC